MTKNQKASEYKAGDVVKVQGLDRVVAKVQGNTLVLVPMKIGAVVLPSEVTVK